MGGGLFGSAEIRDGGSFSRDGGGFSRDGGGFSREGGGFSREGGGFSGGNGLWRSGSWGDGAKGLISKMNASIGDRLHELSRVQPTAKKAAQKVLRRAWQVERPPAPPPPRETPPSPPKETPLLALIDWLVLRWVGVAIRLHDRSIDLLDY